MYKTIYTRRRLTNMAMSATFIGELLKKPKDVIKDYSALKTKADKDKYEREFKAGLDELCTDMNNSILQKAALATATAVIFPVVGTIAAGVAVGPFVVNAVKTWNLMKTNLTAINKGTGMKLEQEDKKFSRVAKDLLRLK